MEKITTETKTALQHLNSETKKHNTSCLSYFHKVSITTAMHMKQIFDCNISVLFICGYWITKITAE